MSRENSRLSEHTLPEARLAVLVELAQKQTWLSRKSGVLTNTAALCENDEEFDLLVDLLSRFHFCTPNDHLENLREIADTIVNKWKCLPSDTRITSLNNGERSDSSDMVAYQLKGILAELDTWHTHNFLNKLREAVVTVPNGGNIVIVDDFAGSGKSISDKVEWLRKELEAIDKAAKIFVALGTSMDAGKSKIEPVVDGCFIVNILSKGITDHYKDDELTAATSCMMRLETTLAKTSGRKKLVDYSFGYKQSETLYYADGLNPPNNNFPLFWWSKLKHIGKINPILPRV